MRVAFTILCRNEADIIASTIDYHLSVGVDHLIVTDNGSVDGTLEILEAYQRRGLLTLLQEPSHTHDQAAWVTRMAAIAHQHYNADWVIHADADEFWWPRATSLAEAIAAAAPTAPALAVNRHNFLPPDPAATGQPFYAAQTIRERHSTNALGRPLPAKVCHGGHPAMAVGDGNHAVFLDGQRLVPQPCNNIEILHFPVRSCAQLERKIRDGTEALARNAKAPAGVGGSWKFLYQTLLQEGGLSGYYASLRPGSEQLQQHLLEGKLIEDRRLEKALQGLG
jgi:hypothetical protein